MGCVLYIEQYYKELTHTNRKAGEYKMGSVGWQGADPKEPVVPLKSEGHLLENSF